MTPPTPSLCARVRLRASIQLSTVAVLLMAFPAFADTGVSDSRVSLPEGPGSISGAGDNASVNANMGSMSFAVPIEVPQGFPEATPSLDIAYNTMGGNTSLGIGWDVLIPSIERMTARGLPEYDTADEFALMGGQELIAVSNAEPREYRARFEGGFIRFRWHTKGTGQEGYWTAETPDGATGYFGADRNGQVVATARSSGARGTFRYYLHEQVDSYGHIVRYSYAKTAGDAQSVPLLRRVEYAFSAETPRFSVAFSYGTRVDAHTDCKPGYCERRSERLAAVEVFSSGVLINRYQLGYEDYAAAGGLSRLAKVERYGADGTLYPLLHTFAYSKALGSLCADSSCAGPKLVSMGNIGGAVQSGNATLIDMNGDALPDIVDTSDASQGGHHKFFISQLAADGTQTFLPPVTATVDGGMSLATPAVEVLDVDGDGFVDMVNARTGDVLRNKGTGSWSELYSLYAQGTGETPDFDEGFQGEDAELRHIRFLDYDNDKRIDIVRSVPTDTQIYRNLGPQGFELDGRAMALGVGFAEGRVQLSDMNGDGLTDPVQISAGQITYNLNLGFGQWGPSREAQVPAFGLEDIPFLEIEDLNGDQLSDLVIVSGSQLRYALNRDGMHFSDDWVRVTTVAGGALPTRVPETVVLFADMNGSGSSDIVWIDQNGAVTYLELFPVLPNLLSRIENGLGMVTEVTYDTSVAQSAASGTPWKYRLPHPMSVVSRLDTWEELSKVHEDTRYYYRDAFYDGAEKQFRGYAHVESLIKGDANQEDGLRTSEYEVGDKDPYRTGLLLEQSTASAGRVLSVSRTTYGDCEILGVPDAATLTRPVRFTCATERVEELREGAAADQHVTMMTTFEYDGYGNATKVSNLGVTSIGGHGCAPCARDAATFGAPCGETCTGDEQYTESKYLAPLDSLGGWQIRNLYQERVYADPSSTFYAEKKIYYDGPAFLGLALGQADVGNPTRVEERVSQDDMVIQASRLRYDANGNVVESIDPNGVVGGSTNRASWMYSADGLVVDRTALHLADAAGKPYVLARSYRYEPNWNRVSASTEWQVESELASADLSAAAITEYAYDEFGRIAAMARPGDTLKAPSTEIVYELGSPVSRVSVRRRSQSGGAPDVETLQCVDGRGRTFQERSLVRPGEYQVTGFQVFNVLGSAVRQYQAYTSPSADCDLTPPADVPYSIMYRDAAYRLTRTVLPDSALYQSASTEEIEYLPLGRVIYDAEDTDPQSPHYATPRIEHTDGLGRLVGVERTLKPGGRTLAHTITYDGLSNLRGYVDPAGHERVQEYDVLGRVFQVRDADTSLTRLFHDAAGNRIRVVDPRGVVTRFTFDGVNRPLAQWEDKREKETRIDYAYDSYPECTRCTSAAGSLVAMRYQGPDGEIEERYGYDVRDRGSYYAKKVHGTWYEVESKFDNADRVLETKYPSGVTFSYETDGLGRVTKVPGYVDQVTYSRKGDPERIAYKNGVVTDYTHDDLTRLLAIKTSTPKQKGLLDFTYKYDRADNVVSVQDKSISGAGASASASYTYDAVYRLIGASLSAGKDGTEELSYGYDDIDNLLVKSSSRGAESPAHVGKYTYSGTKPHQVLAAGDRKFTYDDAGQMTEHAGQKLEWDYMGRMTSASREAGTKTSFSYGATDERVERLYRGHRTTFVTPDFEIRDGHAVAYLTISDRRMAKVEVPSNASTVLTDLAPLSGEGDALRAGRDGKITAADAWVAKAYASETLKVSGVKSPSSPELLLASATRRMLVGEEQQITYFHHDYLGSTVAATDSAGEVVFEARYYPFGEQLASTGGPREEHRFTGKEVDPETGLAYYGARYADPSLGRWVSADPTFAVMSAGMFDRPEEATGPYLFAGNNPTTMVDEDGRLIVNAIGAAVGFVVGVGMATTKAYVTRQDRNATGFQGLKAAVKDNWKGILFAGAMGAGTGFLTGGLSAIGTLAGGTAEMVYFSYKVKKLENAGRLNGGQINKNDYQRLRRNAALVNVGVSVVAGLATGSIASGAFAFHPADAVLHTTSQASYFQPTSLATTGGSAIARSGAEGIKAEIAIRRNNVQLGGPQRMLPSSPAGVGAGRGGRWQRMRAAVGRGAQGLRQKVISK